MNVQVSFTKKIVFIAKETPQSNKFVTVEEELDGIDIDSTGNVLDLPGLMLINKEFRNLKVK